MTTNSFAPSVPQFFLSSVSPTRFVAKSDPISALIIKQSIKGFLDVGKYFDAARYGDVNLSEIKNSSDIHVESHILHAKALIYVGHVDKADKKLTDLQFLLCHLDMTPVREKLYGLVLNSFGYIEWMYYENYGKASELFTEALNFLEAFPDDYATVLDNSARVFAKLLKKRDAEKYAQDALDLRLSTGLVSRILLSKISLANIEFELGEVERAYFWAIDAMQNVTEEYPRGAGLAHLILGRVQTERTQIGQVDSVEFTKRLDEVLYHLYYAMGVFVETVQEPIRLVEIYSALALAYNSFPKTLIEQNNNPEYYFAQAEKWLKASKRLKKRLSTQRCAKHLHD